MTRSLALLLLLLTACTSDPAPRAAPPAGRLPSPATSSPPPSASAPAGAGGVLVAVVRGAAGLELHRVDRRSRAASLERVLSPPPGGGTALDVALSSTRTCATWYVGAGEPFEEQRTALVCYPAGTSAGRVVEGARTPVDVALSPDGTRVAYAELDLGGNQALHVARLDGGSLTAARRFLARADEPPSAFNGTAVQSLAWLDGGELAISTAVESDDGPDLLRFDVASPGERGWLDDGRRVPVRTEGYLTYDGIGSVDGTTALAVERGSYLDQAAPPDRAVRVDLATGRVLEVLATAAAGRFVASASGSRDAVIYVTRGGEEPLKPYLLLAGETRGTAVTGLPRDATQVVTTGRSG